jgi:ribonuclease D
MSTLVASQAALAAITSRARQAGIAAIDTEFVWTRTYYPVLGLIQIALAENEVYLIDAPAVEDKGPIAGLLAAPEVVKILHDASSDLVILNRFCSAVPRAVFDLRLAAGFCGLTSTLSLGRLLQALLGIDLAKTEARSDWLARPLTPAQVSYASDDVRHMPQLYGCLLARLCEHGNHAWAMEEMGGYEAADTYVAAAPEHAYRNVKGMGRLTPEQATVLRELAAWRELEAQRVDRPRNRVLHDEHLLDLALRPPATAADLRHGWRARVREFRRHGESILKCVETARNLPREQWVQALRCPLPAALLKERSDALLALIRDAAQARDIDPTLAGPRRLATSLVLAAARGCVTGQTLLTGWRGELLAERLEPLLAAWR